MTLSGPYAAVGFVVIVGVVYWIGTMLIDHYYKRKTEFVQDLTEKVKEGTNGKSK